MNEELDLFIPLETFSAFITGDQLKELKEYEENKQKFGEGFGERNKPEPIKGSYTRKYFNASAYRINSWFESWDKEEECQIILVHWTNIEGGFSELENIKMSEKEFLKLLPYFGGKMIDLSLPFAYPADNITTTA